MLCATRLAVSVLHSPVSADGMALPTVEMCVSFYFIIIVKLIAHTRAPRGLSPG